METALEPRTGTLPPERPGAPPVLDVVLPVLDEAHVLEKSVELLHDHLLLHMPHPWRITIADNASTDGTLDVALGLAGRLDRIRVLHIDRRGRGLALKTAWSSSDAQVLAYTDVDLSTDLGALVPLVAPLIAGTAEVAIGSRLAPGSAVERGARRELISRSYNLLLRKLFAVHFSDAQCGFKAVRSDAAAILIPAIDDDAWFFDTELLLLAEHNALRMHEVPVRWVEDPDSRVRILRTAIADLRGMARMARRFVVGDGRVAARAQRAGAG